MQFELENFRESVLDGLGLDVEKYRAAKVVVSYSLPLYRRLAKEPDADKGTLDLLHYYKLQDKWFSAFESIADELIVYSSDRSPDLIEGFYDTFSRNQSIVDSMGSLHNFDLKPIQIKVTVLLKKLVGITQEYYTVLQQLTIQDKRFPPLITAFVPANDETDRDNRIGSLETELTALDIEALESCEVDFKKSTQPFGFTVSVGCQYIELAISVIPAICKVLTKHSCSLYGVHFRAGKMVFNRYNSPEVSRKGLSEFGSNVFYLGDRK